MGTQASVAQETRIGIGGRAHLDGLAGEAIEAAASLDYFVPDATTEYVELNGNVRLRLPTPGAPVLRPYLGSGLNYARRSGGAEGESGAAVGLNLAAGLRFEATGSPVPFAEFRRTEGGGDQWVVSAGLLF